MSSQKEKLRQLPKAVNLILSEEKSRDQILLRICQLLHEEIDVYDWVGFYIDDPQTERMLYLGPYVGEATDHTRIPYGKGICGQVAESHETFVVDDVHAQDNYLSCNIHVKSEIVVPVMKGDRFVAQLDIDSHTIAAMDETDKEVLEEICSKLGDLF